MNAVAPGLIEAEMIDDVDRPTLDRIIDQTPMKRIGQAGQIADVVHFFVIGGFPIYHGANTRGKWRWSHVALNNPLSRPVRRTSELEDPSGQASVVGPGCRRDVGT